MSKESSTDKALEFITDYGTYLYEMMRKGGKFSGVGTFLAAMAPKPAHAPAPSRTRKADRALREATRKQIESESEVDTFSEMGKSSSEMEDAFHTLSRIEKQKVNEIMKKKQRRAKPSAETWT